MIEILTAVQNASFDSRALIGMHARHRLVPHEWEIV